MDLIFLYDLPGVGKLTVANELEKLTGYKLFHNHLTVDLVGSVFEFGTSPFVDLREKIWLSIFGRAVKERISGLIFTFVFEKTVTDHFVSDVLDVVESSDGTVHFVTLQCDKQTLEQRIVNPSRLPYGKLTSVTTLNQLLMVVVCGDRHWQYVSVDSATGVREYSSGPASDGHAGGWSNDKRLPEHRYLNVIGGFMEGVVAREDDKPVLIFRHFGVDGNLLNEDRFTGP